MATPSSTLSTTPSTVVALLAITTPFVPTRNCHSAYNLVITTPYESGKGTQSLLVSDPSNPDYMKCQPSGLSNVVQSVPNSFSPAVCPGGWVYYRIATTMLQSRTLTTATCCKSDDFVANGFGGGIGLSVTPMCFTRYHSPLSISATATFSNSSTIFTTGTLVYPAWHITWEASDVSTLSPGPPQITGSATIGSWRTEDPHPPPLPTTTWVNKISGTQIDVPLLYGLVIAIPSGIFIFMVCLVGYCIYKKKKETKSGVPPLPSESNNDITLVDQNSTRKSN